MPVKTRKRRNHRTPGKDEKQIKKFVDYFEENVPKLLVRDDYKVNIMNYIKNERLSPVAASDKYFRDVIDKYYDVYYYISNFNVSHGVNSAYFKIINRQERQIDETIMNLLEDVLEEIEKELEGELEQVPKIVYSASEIIGETFSEYLPLELVGKIACFPTEVGEICSAYLLPEIGCPPTEITIYPNVKQCSKVVAHIPSLKVKDIKVGTVYWPGKIYSVRYKDTGANCKKTIWQNKSDYKIGKK